MVNVSAILILLLDLIFIILTKELIVITSSKPHTIEVLMILIPEVLIKQVPNLMAKVNNGCTSKETLVVT